MYMIIMLNMLSYHSRRQYRRFPISKQKPKPHVKVKFPIYVDVLYPSPATYRQPTYLLYIVGSESTFCLHNMDGFTQYTFHTLHKCI